MDELRRIATPPVKRWPQVRLSVVLIAIGALVLLVSVAVGLGLDGY